MLSDKKIVTKDNLKLLANFLKHTTNRVLDYKVEDDHFTLCYKGESKTFKTPEPDCQYEIIESLKEVASWVNCELFLNLKDINQDDSIIGIYDDYQLLHKIQEASLDCIRLPYLINDDGYFLSDYWSYEAKDFFDGVKEIFKQFDIVSYKGKDFYILPECYRLNFIYKNDYSDYYEEIYEDIFIACFDCDYKEELNKLKDMLLSECVDLNVRGLTNTLKGELIYIDKVDKAYAIEEDFEYEFDKALSQEDLSDLYNIFDIKDNLPRLLKGFCEELDKNVFKFNNIALLNLKNVNC